jgi:hypothetical protein
MFRRKLVQWPNNALLGAYPANAGFSNFSALYDMDFVNGVYTGGTIPEGANTGTLLRQQLVNLNPSFMEQADGSFKTFTATSSVRRTSKGLMSDGADRANQILQNRTLTNASWVATNCTPLKNQTGLTNVANSASQVTVNANNATILQSVTISASAFYGYAFVKRISGSGTIEMTIDSEASYVLLDHTAPALFNNWVEVSKPVQTPGAGTFTMGFRFSTSGDVWAIDFVEVNPVATRCSPVATTTAKLTGIRDRPSAMDTFSSPLQTYLNSTSVRCIYAEFAYRVAGGIITATNGTILNVRSGDCQAFSATVTTGNAPILATSPRLTELNKVMAWQTPSQTGICLNGGTIVTAAGASPGAGDHWDLLTNGSGSAAIFGRCTRLIFYNSVPPNSVIQALTT